MRLKHRHHLGPRASSGTWAVPDLCRAYGFPTGLTATRTAPIGIVSLGGGESPSDTRAAAARVGLPAPAVAWVSVQGGGNNPGSDADGENALDIQVSALAYSYCTGKPAAVRVYAAPNSDAGFAAAVRQAVADGCAVVSISWGAPEDQWSASARRAMDAALASAAAAGIPVFVAAGDGGSSDGERGTHVDYPASSPYAIGCGGTTKAGGSEVVWNDGLGSGTGGGFSAAYQRQPWQLAAPSGPGRMVPDVAANADPATGYEVVLGGVVQAVGGTSAVAPLYAGLFAALAGAGRLPTGPNGILPWLYQHPAGFQDVVSGDNGAFRAMVGPDPCTGLGVPTAALARMLLGGPVSPPSPPPPVVPPAPVPPPPPPAAPNWRAVEADALKVYLAAARRDAVALAAAVRQLDHDAA